MNAKAHIAALFMTSASLIAMVVLLLTSVAPASASEGCPNEARREEQGAAGRALPECRAYELVSPDSTAPAPFTQGYNEGEPEFGGVGRLPEGSDKEFPGSVGIFLTTAVPDNRAANDGNAFIFNSGEQPGPSLALCGCISHRGPTGWVGEDPLPTLSPVTIFCLGSAAVEGFSADLEKLVVSVGSGQERCGHAEPPLVPGEPAELDSHQKNLFLREADGSYKLLDVAPPGVTPQTRFAAISADGSHILFESESTSPLTEDTPPGGVTNIYAWDAAQPESLHLLTVLPDGAAVHGPGEGGAYLASSFNLGHSGHNSEEIQEEASIAGGGVLAQNAEASHAISANGERVLFYAGGSTIEGELEGHYAGGRLYLREHPVADQSALGSSGECTEPEKACTIQIDESQSGSGSGGGQFQWANPETTEVVFTDEEKLTPGSTAESGKPDLYEYDLEKPKGQRLTDLTADPSEPADVRGVSGASEDGSSLYFIAKGDLTGAQQNSHGDTALAPTEGTGTLTAASAEVTGVSATAGAFHVGMAISGSGIPIGTSVAAVGAGILTLSQRATESGTQGLSAEAGNLYLRHGGTTIFIAALNPASPDICDWRATCLSARVSQNGAFIAFNSVDSLTGYDNAPLRPSACTTGRVRDPGTPTRWPCIEVFRYAATSGGEGELTCASCNPDGSPPAAEFAYAEIEGATYSGAAWAHPLRQSHNVSDSGEVFFNTMEKLLPADENETWDVYDYNGGEGQSAQLHLISTGKSEQPSYFADATPDGDDVFFATTQPLLRADTRAGFDLYDARVDGGFAEPLIPPCEAEGCRPAYPGTPASSSPASASLEGKGNVHPAGKGKPHPAKCKKGFVKKKGKCLKQRKKKPKKAKKPIRRVPK